MDHKEPRVFTEEQWAWIQKLKPAFAAGGISAMVAAPYFYTVNEPFRSSMFAEFGSYFGGISTGIGVLLAGASFFFQVEKNAHDNKSKKEDEQFNAFLETFSEYDREIKIIENEQNDITVEILQLKNETLKIENEIQTIFDQESKEVRKEFIARSNHQMLSRICTYIASTMVTLQLISDIDEYNFSKEHHNKIYKLKSRSIYRSALTTVKLISIDIERSNELLKKIKQFGSKEEIKKAIKVFESTIEYERNSKYLSHIIGIKTTKILS